MIANGRIEVHLGNILLMDNPKEFRGVAGYLACLDEETRFALRNHPTHGAIVDRLIDDCMYESYSGSGNGRK